MKSSLLTVIPFTLMLLILFLHMYNVDVLVHTICTCAYVCVYRISQFPPFSAMNVKEHELDMNIWLK